MSIPWNKTRVRVDLSRIRANYRLLAGSGSGVVPVVKADAYGHGLLPVAKALAEEGADTFAVGTVEEAVALASQGPAARILALLGPIDAEDYDAAVRHKIIPFVGNLDQIERLAQAAQRQGCIAEACLKFDTGMSRLGFSDADLPALLERLARLPSIRPVWACSHLATADDDADASFALAQGACFGRILEQLRAAGCRLVGCLANSAAILAHKTLHFDAQRAGIALYGANPFHGTTLAHLGEGLAPAMDVCAPVVEVRELAPGQGVSYGRTFIAERPLRVAIVAVGYADAYSRGLSNKGAMLLGGRRAKVLGRVCMQLTAVDASQAPDCKPGDRAHLLGGPGPQAIRPEELAAWWGTIPYEVFCLLGLNERQYV